MLGVRRRQQSRRFGKCGLKLRALVAVLMILPQKCRACETPKKDDVAVAAAKVRMCEHVMYQL